MRATFSSSPSPWSQAHRSHWVAGATWPSTPANGLEVAKIGGDRIRRQRRPEPVAECDDDAGRPVDAAPGRVQRRCDGACGAAPVELAFDTVLQESVVARRFIEDGALGRIGGHEGVVLGSGYGKGVSDRNRYRRLAKTCRPSLRCRSVGSRWGREAASQRRFPAPASICAGRHGLPIPLESDGAVVRRSACSGPVLRTSPFMRCRASSLRRACRRPPRAPRARSPRRRWRHARCGPASARWCHGR